MYQKTITAGTNVIENVGEKNALFENNPHHKGVAVTGGFDLVLASGSELQPDFDSGAHELIHLLGIDDKGENDNSIAGYKRPRNRPTGQDFEEVFRNSNIDLKSKEVQIIRGIIK